MNTNLSFYDCGLSGGNRWWGYSNSTCCNQKNQKLFAFTGGENLAIFGMFLSCDGHSPFDFSTEILIVPLADLQCDTCWTCPFVLWFQTETRRLTPSSRWWFPGWSPSASSSRWPCSPPSVSSSPASSSASTSSTDIQSKWPFCMYTVSRFPTCNDSRFERTSGSASRFLATEIIGTILKVSVTTLFKPRTFLACFTRLVVLNESKGISKTVFLARMGQQPLAIPGCNMKINDDTILVLYLIPKLAMLTLSVHYEYLNSN